MFVMYIILVKLNSVFIVFMLQFRPSRPERNDQRQRIGIKMQKIGKIAGQTMNTYCIYNIYVNSELQIGCCFYMLSIVVQCNYCDT